MTYGADGSQGNGYAGNPWGFWTQVAQTGLGFGGNGGSHGGSGNGSSGGGSSTPTPSGVATGAAFNGQPQINLFDAGSNYVAFHQPAGQNYLSMYYIKEYNCLRGDMYFNDLSGGIDAQVRMLRDGPFTNEVAFSTLQTSFSRSVNLPPLTTLDNSSANEIGTIEAMSSCYLNDGGTPRWLAAAGDTADKCLFALDTNAGTPRVTAQTYTPSSNIVSLTTVKLVTNTERVIVGRAGAAAQVLTGFNGTPTTSGTMHANTTQLWGCIRSPLNSTTQGAETLLLYCNDGLYSLSSATSALSDAPTAVLTNWPGGGYALGITTLADEGVARAYWVHPLNDSSTSMLDAMDPGKIVTTDLEGTDPKTVNTGLPFVRHALLWNGGIVATDGKTINFINQGIVDLAWNRERYWGSGYPSNTFGFGSVMCLAVIQDRLFAAIATITQDANDVNGPAYWEEYHPEDNKWTFVAYVDTNQGLLPNLAAFTGQTPVYQPHGSAVDNGVFFWYAKIGGGLVAPTYNWAAIPLLASGVNPQWQQTESAYIRYKFDTDGVLFTPVYQFFGLPIHVSDIWFGGTLAGSGSQVGIVINTPAYPRVAPVSSGLKSATFKDGTDWRHQWWFNNDEGVTDASMGTAFQLILTMSQGSSGTYVTKTSPNALPFRVGFYIFMDGQYKSPKTIEPDRYWGPREL